MRANSSSRVALLAATLASMVTAIPAGTAPGTPSFRTAMEHAVAGLLGDFFTERGAGSVLEELPRRRVVLRFSVPPPVDAEYLVVRPADGGSASRRTVGAVRITGTDGRQTQAVTLWGEGDLRPGDEVVWPARLAVLLYPTETDDASDVARYARRLDGWLELQLLTDRRVRVIRVETQEAVRWYAGQLREAGEYGLVVAPLLGSGEEGVEITLRVRSVLTGQTLARRQGLWARRPAPPPAGAPEPSGREPAGAAPPVDIPKGPTPYGQGIERVAPTAPRASLIEHLTPKTGHVRLHLDTAASALAVGDVDGDGRVEIVTVTPQQVHVSRWTGHGLERVATGVALPAFTSYLHVDVADLDGDGRAEIVLVAVRSVTYHNRVDNTVVATFARVREGQVVPLGPELDRHVSVLRRPGRRPLLLAQRLGSVEPATGPVAALEWRPGEVRPVVEVTPPGALGSVYGAAAADVDGDQRVDWVTASPEGHLAVLDNAGRRRWASDDDLGQVEGPGFAQTPRFPDYRGHHFDATAEQLAVWRAVPRRVLVVESPGGGVEIVTVANPRPRALRLLGAGRDELRGRAVGYGWDRATNQLTRRWQTAELAGAALDLAVGDLDGERQLLVLSATGDRHALEVFTIYERAPPGGAPSRR